MSGQVAEQEGRAELEGEAWDRRAFDLATARLQAARETLRYLADGGRLDEFSYGELSAILDNAELDEWGNTYVAELDALRAAAARPSPGGSGEVVAELAARAFANSERWFPDSHAQGDWAISLHMALGIGGESGEVLDVIKKADVCGGLVDDCDKHAPGKHDRAALGSEMADLFTYLLNLAHHHGIDLAAEFEAKQAVCAQRWDR